MNLTGSQSQAYWTAVAQIVPVLALAVAIEARVLGGRWQKKKYAKLRGRRWAAASIYVVLIGTLPYLMFRAVQNVASKETFAFDYWYAIIWITLCTVMVAYLPATTIVSAALIDMFAALGRMLPWSQVKRNHREMERLEPTIAQLDRDLRSAHIEFLGIYANYLLSVTGIAVAFDQEIEKASGAEKRALRRALADFEAENMSIDKEHLTPQLAKYAQARKRQDEITARFRQAEASEPKWAERDLEMVRQMLARAQ